MRLNLAETHLGARLAYLLAHEYISGADCDLLVYGLWAQLALRYRLLVDINHGGVVRTSTAQLCLRVSLDHQLEEGIEFVLTSLHTGDELAARCLP